MGVTYKLKEEVVHFIISQRQSDPFASCRQLAESTSQKFGLHLSKSSVHDVLKESGIVTPRGRKPKNKFEIPQERKKQIQEGLSQVKLLPDPTESSSVKRPNTLDIAEVSPKADEAKQSFKEIAALPTVARNGTMEALPQKQIMEISSEYEGAGRVFLKAVFWDLGISSERELKETDWDYYLTYSKGIKVSVENDKSFFIDLPLPLERCIREAVDGLVNNVKPLIVSKVSDEELFKACMSARSGSKINKISIVDGKDHILLEISNVVDLKRNFSSNNRIFVESIEKDPAVRLRSLFFPQIHENNIVIDNLLNLKGFDSTNKYENIVTLLINDSYENKAMLQEAVERLNSMYIYDEHNRLVMVKTEKC